MIDRVPDPLLQSRSESTTGLAPAVSSRHNIPFFQALARSYRIRVGIASAAKNAPNGYLFQNNGTGMDASASTSDLVPNAPVSGTAIGANRPSGSINHLINAAARQESVPRELLAAVVKVESGFQPKAESPVGAKGLTQLMDGTARSLGVTDSFDPWQNLVGGARFLRGLLTRYNGNVTLAVAAYNAGPGAVDSYGGTVPPYAETRSYVRQVLGVYHQNLSDAGPGGSQ